MKWPHIFWSQLAEGAVVLWTSCILVWVLRTNSFEEMAYNWARSCIQRTYHCWPILGWIFASFNLNVLRYPIYTVLHQHSQAWHHLCFKGSQYFEKSNDDYSFHYTCIIICINVWRYFSIYRNWNTNYIFNLHPLIPWIIRHMRNRQEAHDPDLMVSWSLCFHLIYFTSILCLFQYTFDTWYYGLTDVIIMRDIFFLTCDYSLFMVNSLGPEELYLVVDSMDTPENDQLWSR